jgi:hypothetical protein
MPGELSRAQGKDARAAGSDILDHDVEVELLWYRRPGEVGGSLPHIPAGVFGSG